ncbi:MAG: LTA synthase family protein [Planctomycetota bacterium]|jgi:phosphoglycerol transferase MdoB-like AlkP superfamily enzyme
MSRFLEKIFGKKKQEQAEGGKIPDETKPGLKHQVIDFLILLGLTVSALWMWRLIRLFEHRDSITIIDLRGFIIDLWLCVPIAYVLRLARRIHLAVPLALLVAWSFAQCSAYEHVRALGVLPDVANVAFLGDVTFIGSSAVAFTHPIVLAVYLVLVGVAFWFYARGRKLPNLPIFHSAVVAAGLAFILIWPYNARDADWRQGNFVTVNAMRLLTLRRIPDVNDPKIRALVSLAYRADLNGKPLYRAKRKKPNVLLVLLEGISGSGVKCIRGHHGITDDINLEFLDRLCGEGIYCPNFLTQQGQTNRGEYAILTGDYPKLLTGKAKMTEVSMGEWSAPSYLPAVLRDAGYRTVYIQAAPMPFMMKDKFMEIAGFDEQHGAEYFTRAYKRSTWGVDDKAFFEQVLDSLKEIDSGEKPWFVTLLTVGTHHPYVVPEEYTEHEEEEESVRALHYMDAALESFVSGLRAGGLLEDTLLIITCDEATIFSKDKYKGIVEANRNWGLLVVLTPEREKGVIGAPYALNDIPVSLLDYLGLRSAARKFTGRSFFRKYSHPRNVFFANVYQKRIGVYTSGGGLLICGENFETILYERYDGDAIFRTGGEISARPPVSLLMAIAKKACTTVDEP